MKRFAFGLCATPLAWVFVSAASREWAYFEQDKVLIDCRKAPIGAQVEVWIGDSSYQMPLSDFEKLIIRNVKEQGQ